MFDLNSSTQHITSGDALAALGLPHRVRVPNGPGKHPAIIMVHGLDGSEDVTWIFARVIGPQWLILTPRAPLTSDGGFCWYPSTPPDRDPDPALFAVGLQALERFVTGAVTHYPIDPAQVVLLGFSQGAAMSYAYALSHRADVSGLAALAGFIPHSISAIPALNKLPVLILHGTQDERVPVAFARSAREQLIAAGAAVTYEESEVGHKVSAQGMRTLASWLAARSS